MALAAVAAVPNLLEDLRALSPEHDAIISSVALRTFSDRVNKEALNPSLARLAEVFDDRDRVTDASDAFKRLYQNSTPFAELWIDFSLKSSRAGYSLDFVELRDQFLQKIAPRLRTALAYNDPQLSIKILIILQVDLLD
ncbi:hypothetical protein K440DRAFT_680300 [Wilcoxina mikolae CBS 423.85]|nr:hypothetical protein K440DRAFT_680300 [Wilcoxina mikolae CBS 423.85]